MEQEEEGGGDGGGGAEHILILYNLYQVVCGVGPCCSAWMWTKYYAVSARAAVDGLRLGVGGHWHKWRHEDNLNLNHTSTGIN